MIVKTFLFLILLKELKGDEHTIHTGTPLPPLTVSPFSDSGVNPSSTITTNNGLIQPQGFTTSQISTNSIFFTTTSMTPPYATNGTTIPAVITTTTNPNSASNYIGYLRLNNTEPSVSPLSQSTVMSWLQSVTNRTFSMVKFNQTIVSNQARRKRSSTENVIAWFEVETKATDFYKAFQAGKNQTTAQKVGNYTVMEAYLWSSNAGLCPNNTKCEDNTFCRVNDRGNFYCKAILTSDSPSQANPNNRNLYALLVIPCFLALVIIIAIIVYLVHRKKRKQDVFSKIYPPNYENVRYHGTQLPDTVGKGTASFNAGFSTVNSLSAIKITNEDEEKNSIGLY